MASFFAIAAPAREHFIGPAKSMEIQNAIGADIIMAFDDCVKNPATYDQALASMERTHRWLQVCVEKHTGSAERALFGIVQGSMFEELRRRSAKIVSDLDLPGIAIGGVAVGEDRQTIERIVQFTTPLLPEGKPRYLMGVGTPWDISFAIKCGIDMFDCVSPTRLARHGAAFTRKGRISLRTSKYATDFTPLEDDCQCPTCLTHHKAYIHHLFRQKEMSGGTLLSIHNVFHLVRQAQECRQAILNGTFKSYFQQQLELHAADCLARAHPES